MSFNDISVEIFREIASYTSGAEKQCLRITCRGFYSLILPDITITRPPPPQLMHFVSPAPFPSDVHRIQYAVRLFRPGNIFWRRGMEFCPICLCVFGPDIRSAFRRYEVQGLAVCSVCAPYSPDTILRFATNWRFTYGGDEMFTCWDCRYAKPVSGSLGLHRHFQLMVEDQDLPSANDAVCSACHYDYCRDIECEGWPRGFVEANIGLFCENHEHRFTPMRCASCPPNPAAVIPGFTISIAPGAPSPYGRLPGQYAEYYE